MTILRLDVAEIAAKVAPRPKGTFYFRHHKPEPHKFTVITGTKVKRYTTLIAQSTPPLNAA